MGAAGRPHLGRLPQGEGGQVQFSEHHWNQLELERAGGTSVEGKTLMIATAKMTVAPLAKDPLWRLTMENLSLDWLTHVGYVCWWLHALLVAQPRPVVGVS